MLHHDERHQAPTRSEAAVEARDTLRRKVFDVGSFTAAPCPDQPGSQRAIANRTAEQQLKLPLEVTSQVVSILRLQDLVRATSSPVRRIMQYDGVGVLLPEAEGKALRYQGFDVRDGLRAPPATPFPAGASSAGEVLRTDRLVVLNPVPRQTNPFYAYIPDEECTLVEIPLSSRTRTLGLLTIVVAKERPFDDHELRRQEAGLHARVAGA